MALSELTLHHVLQTYSHQERLGRVQRGRTRRRGAGAGMDPVILSIAGRKVQWLAQFAEQIVSLRHPETPFAQRIDRVRATTAELLALHGQQVLDDDVSPEALEELLRSLHGTG